MPADVPPIERERKLSPRAESRTGMAGHHTSGHATNILSDVETQSLSREVAGARSVEPQPYEPRSADATRTNSCLAPVPGTPIFVEICCGKGRLAACMTLRGFDAAGVDHKYNRHSPICKVIEIDLGTPHGLQLLLRICQEPRLAAVWFGVPCGTSSHDRENPIAHGPPQLRTERQPWGRTDVDLDTLQHGSSARLEAANGVYRAMISAIVSTLQARNIPWAIENPATSLLWWIPEIDDLLKLGAKDYLYDACMHGGTRRKPQRIRSTIDFSSMEALCDGRHEHAPWKRGCRLYMAEEA